MLLPKMKAMLFLSLVLFQYVCHTFPESNSTFPYQSNTPNKTFQVPKELEEISGLSMSDDGQYLVAVQDEDGIVFYLDKNTGKIERQVKFWDQGDYEGVEVVGKEVYVVKSTGTIYRISEDGKEVEKFNLGLGAENDVEGLAYDAKNNRLLLACKNQAATGEDAKDKKGIYAFDLNKKTLSENPVYRIIAKEAQTYLSGLPNTEDKEKLMDSFKSDEMSFAPSAIAVHPRTSELYVLSSAGNVLIVLDRNGKISQIEKLKKKIHLQPEGICFDAEGTMYISNEAKDGEPGKIHVFKAK